MEEGRWPNLSNDVLALILKRLNTQADLCRFRSICKSWRSFATPLQPHILFPLSLPSIQPKSRPFSLSPTLLYLLSPNPNSPFQNPKNVWLIKVSETGENNHQRWALLNPLTKEKLYCPSGLFRNKINLLGFNNLEVGRSYRLNSVGDVGETSFDFGDFSSSIIQRKVAVKTFEELVVLALEIGKIALWKMGDQDWKILETGQANDFDDVICYEEKFYLVDRKGRLAMIDPTTTTTTFELIEVVDPMEVCYSEFAYLLESNFHLYLVIKIGNPRPVNYYDEEQDDWVLDKTIAGKPTGFKIFMFNERNKGWEKVESLGNRVFFVSREGAFSVCTEDLGWSKGNCIYFEGLTGYDDDDVGDMGFGLNAGVYSLEDQSVSTFSSLDDPRTRIFRPPLNWFVGREDYPECEMLDQGPAC